jgi:MGT family glycosyltransferase
LAKACFLSLPLHGHVNPSLPLVRALTERAVEVVYYGTDRFAPAIEQAGGRFRRYRSEFLRDLRQLPDRMHEVAWLLMQATGEVLEHDLPSIHAESFDVLIADSVAPWGHWAGEKLDLPVVTSVPTFAFNRHVLAYGVARGVRPKSAGVLLSKLRYITKAALLQRRLRRRFVVRGPGLMQTLMGHSDLNIVYTSRLFQPCIETFDGRYEFVGPSFGPRMAASPFPWERVRPDFVYVSLGTLFNTDPAFYKHCFDAFRDAPYQIVMSTGGAQAGFSTRDIVPGNFILESYVPQLEVLARASAFVSHGGMNSVSESLAHAVPVAVVPQMGEQAIVGQRVEELGAGLLLWKRELTPDRLRSAIDRLRSEPRFRAQAGVIRESFQEAGGARRAAESVSTFVHRRRPKEAARHT